jgi:hypothetical protein
MKAELGQGPPPQELEPGAAEAQQEERPA